VVSELPTHSQRCVRILVAVAVSTALGLTLLPPPRASADDLIDRRQQVRVQLSQARADLDESSTQLTSAVLAVGQARGQLTAARSRLASTRRDLDSAKATDSVLAATLKAAQAELVRAKAAVARGQHSLDDQLVLVGEMARVQYQQQTNLLPVAILVASNSTADLQTRLQWSATMFDTARAHIDRLTLLQSRLTAQRARQAEVESQLAADRIVAADNLVTKAKLDRQARTDASIVAGLVRRRASTQAVAQRTVGSDREQYAALTRERASVDHRIAVRIAQAKAAAARKAAAERAARIAAQQRAHAAAVKAAADARAAREEAHRAAVKAAADARAAREEAHRAALRAAAEARAARVAQRKRAHLAAVKAAAAERAHRSADARRIRRAAAADKARTHAKEVDRARAAQKQRSAAREDHDRKQARKARSAAERSARRRLVTANPRQQTRSSDFGRSAHHGFIYPVGRRITSPYGRRFHPVLHVWRLHDGTDFGAGCGTAMRAAYSGQVAERFYSSAYGNRLMIDHGRVDGRYVTTGYNHAQRYTVRVGQRVRKGQLIGYVGATGYSTGCHLHLMIWTDGHRINPMSWL